MYSAALHNGEYNSLMTFLSQLYSQGKSVKFSLGEVIIKEFVTSPISLPESISGIVLLNVSLDSCQTI